MSPFLAACSTRSKVVICFAPPSPGFFPIGVAAVFRVYATAPTPGVVNRLPRIFGKQDFQATLFHQPQTSLLDERLDIYAYNHHHFEERRLSLSIHEVAPNEGARSTSAVQKPGWKAGLATLARTWELYPLLLLVIVFHFYNLNLALYHDDQTTYFQAAYEAVRYGYWPITGTSASVGSFLTPGPLYLFMIPAAISSNPLGGEILVALLNSLAIVITYFFVRRYYGRPAGIIASFLYASSVVAWSYSRDIWGPDLVSFFVILYVFVIFRGIVDRRKGWFFWALVLLGVIYEVHETALIVGACLLPALLFGWKRIRVREIVGAIAANVVIQAPFLFWEIHNHFADIKAIFSGPAVGEVYNRFGFDIEVLRMYRLFFSPLIYVPYHNQFVINTDDHLIPSSANTVLSSSLLQNSLKAESLLTTVVFVVAVFLLLYLTIGISSQKWQQSFRGVRFSAGLKQWWLELSASPQRQGLIILLIWQFVPLLYLLHHRMPLWEHYILGLLPGPFILVALGLVKASERVQELQFIKKQGLLYAIYGLAAILILAQCVGLTGTFVDQSTGRIQTNRIYAGWQVTSLSEMQHVLQQANALAERYHVDRIYSMDNDTLNLSLKYLATLSKTPLAVYNSQQCMLLPGSSSGPAIYVLVDGAQYMSSLLNTYTNATLLEQINRVNYPTEPYQIYLVSARPAPVLPGENFTGGVQALSSNVQVFQNYLGPSLVSRWQLLGAHTTQPYTTYNLNVTAQAVHSDVSCSYTANWTGDQMFVFSLMPKNTSIPSQVSLQASVNTTLPHLLHVGPLILHVLDSVNTPLNELVTSSRRKSLTFQVTR
jgi:4-amino-4-deoxy-L-arabinose transferase-like glycosyltransferase